MSGEHVHQWTRRQNVTSRGYTLPPYETCDCGDARPLPDYSAPEPREDARIGGADVSVSFPDERDTAVAEVGLTDAEWTRLRHAAGNRVVLGPIAEEVERILAERERAAAVEALREAADDLIPFPGNDYGAFPWGVQTWLRDRADRRHAQDNPGPAQAPDSRRETER